MNQEAVQQVAMNNAGGSPLVNVPNVDAQTPTPYPTTNYTNGRRWRKRRYIINREYSNG